MTQADHHRPAPDPEDRDVPAAAEDAAEATDQGDDAADDHAGATREGERPADLRSDPETGSTAPDPASEGSGLPPAGDDPMSGPAPSG